VVDDGREASVADGERQSAHYESHE
jgi:hypothetical protein